MAFDDTNKELLLYNTHLNVNFKESPTRANVKSGENISTSLGKIQKYLNDLGDAAFLDTDTAPTQNSTNPITSGAVYTALASKQNELSQAQLAAANSGITAAKLTADEAALVEVVDSGAKNIADMGKTNFTTATSHGVTVSRNGDVFTINGTSDTNDNIFFNIYYKDLSTNMVPAGDWVASITPTNSKIQLRGGINGSITQFAGYGAPLFLTIPEGTTNNWVRIVANASTTFNNETFRLMLCTKTEWDVSHQFEPYALSNPVITPALIEQVDNGVKNLFNATSGAQSVNGFTLTPNGDGTYTVGGTRTTSGAVWMSLGSISLEGDYFLSGAASNSCRLTATVDGIAQYDYGSGVELNGVISNNVYINIPTSVSSLSGVIVKPMICTKAAWDVSHQFEPYALSNPTLTPAVIKAVDEGAKNLLKIVATSQSYDGGNITFTVNADQTVTVNATNNHAQQSLILAYLGQEFYGKTVVISGCPEGGDFSTGYYLLIYKASGSTTITYDIGNSVTLTIPNEDCRIAIGVRANAVVDNRTFKPMICTKAAWNASHTFVPYALTNPELTSKLMTDEADITSLKHMVNPRSQSQVSSGNLDNITVSEMRVYSSPSGLPTGVSASSVCIVETCVVDSNSAYQVITLLTNQGTAQNRSYPTYKRVKVGGVWYDWKLIVS